MYQILIRPDVFEKIDKFVLSLCKIGVTLEGHDLKWKQSSASFIVDPPPPIQNIEVRLVTEMKHADGQIYERLSKSFRTEP
jgi:hypothetical protein